MVEEELQRVRKTQSANQDWEESAPSCKGIKQTTGSFSICRMYQLITLERLLVQVKGAHLHGIIHALGNPSRAHA